jgi:RimJ/RimL family protein N-acetyltransferase
LGPKPLFSYVEEHSQSTALDLVYHLAPWDQSLFQANTAAISSIRLRPGEGDTSAFTVFRDWCTREDVVLVSCRLAQDQLAECGFLEAQGFRFIELNYRPFLSGLAGFVPDPEISICPAAKEDVTEISAMASRIFQTGRLHIDPMVGRELGDRRYAAWVENAFSNPSQQLFKFLINDRISAFMVIEQPTPTSRFWSLVGLAPGLSGRGLGRRAWQSMLAFHHAEGVQQVTTSISSHNLAALNLYVSLGFRFPAPAITLHWCPFGPIKPEGIGIRSGQ